jgi:hypothetical protein
VKIQQKKRENSNLSDKRAPLLKLRAKEECHSFFSKGAMWEWPSFFKGRSGSGATLQKYGSA